MADLTELAVDFARRHPVDVARALETEPPADSADAVNGMPEDVALGVMRALLPVYLAQAIPYLKAERTTALLRALPLLEAAGVLRHMTPEARSIVLDTLPRRLSTLLGLNLRYPRAVVGAWMNTTVFAVAADSRIPEIFDQLKQFERYDLDRVFLTDGEQRLTGSVLLARLIQADETASLSAIAAAEGHRLTANASVLSALDHPGWRQADALPVTDKSGKLIGSVRHSDLRLASGGGTVRVHSHRTADAMIDMAENCYGSMAELLTASLQKIETVGSERND